MIAVDIVKFKKQHRPNSWDLLFQNTGSKPIYGASIDAKVLFMDGTTSSEMIAVDDIDPGEKTHSSLTLLRRVASIKLYRLTMVAHDYSDMKEVPLDLTYRKKMFSWEKVG